MTRPDPAPVAGFRLLPRPSLPPVRRRHTIDVVTIPAMRDAVPNPTKNPFRRFLPVALAIAAAFAGGFLLRGARPATPRPSASVPVPRPEERLRVPDVADLDRFVGVVVEVGPGSVVVMAPDRPGPGGAQHRVTLRVTAATRVNSLLEKGLLPGQTPEEGGIPATLDQILKDDLVGFTGGSPYGASEIDAATITIVGRAPPTGTTAK